MKKTHTLWHRRWIILVLINVVCIIHSLRENCQMTNTPNTWKMRSLSTFWKSIFRICKCFSLLNLWREKDESKKKSFSPEVSCRFLCVYTSSWLYTFLFKCLYTNKNLENERVITFLTHTSPWRVYTFLKQDGVSNDPKTFSYVIQVYKRVYVYTKVSQIVWQREFSWTHHRTGLTVSLRTSVHIPWWRSLSTVFVFYVPTRCRQKTFRC
jgi:hypothetical protein